MITWPTICVIKVSTGWGSADGWPAEAACIIPARYGSCHHVQIARTGAISNIQSQQVRTSSGKFHPHTAYACPMVRHNGSFEGAATVMVVMVLWAASRVGRGRHMTATIVS